MIPPHQRLAAGNGSRAHVHLGLIPHLHFTVGQGVFQLAVQFMAQQGLLPHMLIVEHHGNAGRALGFQPRIVGQIQHELHVPFLLPGYAVGPVDGAHRVGQCLTSPPFVQFLVHFADSAR